MWSFFVLSVAGCGLPLEHPELAAPVDPARVCSALELCTRVVAPEQVDAVEDLYGEYGACWELGTDEVCREACAADLVDLWIEHPDEPTCGLETAGIALTRDLAYDAFVTRFCAMMVGCDGDSPLGCDADAIEPSATAFDADAAVRCLADDWSCEYDDDRREALEYSLPDDCRVIAVVVGDPLR